MTSDAAGIPGTLAVQGSQFTNNLGAGLHRRGQHERHVRPRSQHRRHASGGAIEADQGTSITVSAGLGSSAIRPSAEQGATTRREWSGPVRGVVPRGVPSPGISTRPSLFRRASSPTTRRSPDRGVTAARTFRTVPPQAAVAAVAAGPSRPGRSFFLSPEPRAVPRHRSQ